MYETILYIFRIIWVYGPYAYGQAYPLTHMVRPYEYQWTIQVLYSVARWLFTDRKFEYLDHIDILNNILPRTHSSFSKPELAAVNCWISLHLVWTCTCYFEFARINYERFILSNFSSRIEAACVLRIYFLYFFLRVYIIISENKNLLIATYFRLSIWVISHIHMIICYCKIVLIGKKNRYN